MSQVPPPFHKGEDEEHAGCDEVINYSLGAPVFYFFVERLTWVTKRLIGQR
jgi:hypothetical protein